MFAWESCVCGAIDECRQRIPNAGWGIITVRTVAHAKFRISWKHVGGSGDNNGGVISSAFNF